VVDLLFGRKFNTAGVQALVLIYDEPLVEPIRLWRQELDDRLTTKKYLDESP